MEPVADLFSAFYRALNGHDPYAWQVRLAQDIVETGTWPSAIVAPTGAGKSVVVDVHVFANALAGEGHASSRVPRRLFLTVNRRAIVDAQYEHAAAVQEALRRSLEGVSADGGAASERSAILGRMAHGLVRRWGEEGGLGGASPLLVERIRGGADADMPSGSWRYCPEAPMVICATPDMIGSRLLFRGYGTSVGARPIEAGLVAYDSVVVVDEAHLNRQLVKTARQVCRIEMLSEAVASGELGAPLQVVESTATPVLTDGDAVSALALSEDDVRGDDELSRRLTRPKRVEVREGNAKEGLFVEQMTEACLDLGARGEGTVAAIANTVPVALGVAGALAREVGEEAVLCIVGRMRPWDRKEVLESLLARGDGTPRYIVGTQALEVGIDFDCRTLVTEVAPVPALIQRTGRLNRFGAFEEGRVLVFDRPGARGPYDEGDLEGCRRWLRGLPSEGVTALGLSSQEVPAQTARRSVFQRLEESDVRHLAHTSERMGAETGAQTGESCDLDLWLRDELGQDDDHDVGLVVRAGLPQDDRIAADLLCRVPPVADEVFPCDFQSIRRVLEIAREGVTLAGDGPVRLFCSPDGLHYDPVEVKEHQPRPGNLYVVDAERARLFMRGVVRPPERKEIAKGAVGSRETAHDVYAAVCDRRGRKEPPLPFVLDAATLRKACGLGRHVDSPGERDAPLGLGRLRAPGFVHADDAFSTALRAFDEEARAWAQTEEDERCGVTQLVREGLVDRLDVPGERLPALERLLDGAELLFDRNADGEPSRVIVVCGGGGLDDPAYGVETRSRESVTLADHAAAVAHRARMIAQAVGLAPRLCDALELAGRHHDDGKADSRFQKLLGKANPAAGPLAKSASDEGGSRGDVLRMRRRLGLVGWRHEQLSAAMAWTELEGRECVPLVTRLVGTTHGWGRDTFACAGSELCGDASIVDRYGAAMRGLFDQGVWESLIERTNDEFGRWGCAYLEALLRAADVRVSAGDVL